MLYCNVVHQGGHQKPYDELCVEMDASISVFPPGTRFIHPRQSKTLSRAIPAEPSVAALQYGEREDVHEASDPTCVLIF